MKKYNIPITVNLNGVLEIEAENLDDAIKIASDKMNYFEFKDIKSLYDSYLSRFSYEVLKDDILTRNDKLKRYYLVLSDLLNNGINVDETDFYASILDDGYTFDEIKSVMGEDYSKAAYIHSKEHGLI